ncbi:hypothetical protein [Pseudomonas taiwanensis]|uniref:hypothetical protein n=1 Tax=Pseudomonas taiwanensis TaxID=470150 RepID=UPI0016486572|nr:hypothetical protein [Pseudomonas taiwanensis]
MTREEYQQLFEQERPALEAWGAFIIEKVDTLLNENFTETELKHWIKIPPSLRVKDTESLLAKAFILNKGWFGDSYEEITDKVGVRYVVGLTDHIDHISGLVSECEYWHTETSKEFDSWRKSDPRIFDYQSAHHIITSFEDIIFNDIEIPAGTTCELQIRTLLQHAYAELSHDTVYKSTTTQQPEVHRLFAKSMALMETTDDMLSRAKHTSDSAASIINSWRKIIITSTATDLKKLKLNEGQRENDYLIDKLSPLIKMKYETDYRKFVSEHSELLTTRIALRSKTDDVFSLSAITLVYFLAKTKRHSLASVWPFTQDLLSGIYSDLGISPPTSYD